MEFIHVNTIKFINMLNVIAEKTNHGYKSLYDCKPDDEFDGIIYDEATRTADDEGCDVVESFNSTDWKAVYFGEKYFSVSVKVYTRVDGRPFVRVAYNTDALVIDIRNGTWRVQE